MSPFLVRAGALSVALALAVAGGGCGSGSGAASPGRGADAAGGGSADGGGADGGGTRDAFALPEVAPLHPPAGAWTWVDVPESACDDGSPTGIAVNPGTSGDLFIYFEGGGACWDGFTCLVLNAAVHGPFGAAQWQARAASIDAGPFARARASNPFRDATQVYIPYCTGDLHAGDNVAQYPLVAGGTMAYHHVGRRNAVAAAARLAATWPAPPRVVVSGSSAGGYGAALNYDLLRRAYPAARVYLLDDSGPLLEQSGVPPDTRAAWFAQWRLGDVTDALCGTDCRTDLSALYPALAARYPQDRMALLSSLRDATIRTYMMLTPDQFQADLLALVQDRFAPTTTQRAFLVAGETHVQLPAMATLTTAGTTLESWLDTMVNDRAPWPAVAP